MCTHETHWWKKASEISTLQKLDMLFTIVTKKDLFSVQFPFQRPNVEEKTFFSKEYLPKADFFNFLLRTNSKQRNLEKLYKLVSNVQQKRKFENVSFFPNKLPEQQQYN